MPSSEAMLAVPAEQLCRQQSPSPGCSPPHAGHRPGGAARAAPAVAPWAWRAGERQQREALGSSSKGREPHTRRGGLGGAVPTLLLLGQPGARAQHSPAEPFLGPKCQQRGWQVPSWLQLGSPTSRVPGTGVLPSTAPRAPSATAPRAGHGHPAHLAAASPGWHLSWMPTSHRCHPHTDATSHGCLPEADADVHSLAVPGTLGRCPLVLHQQVCISFHLQAELLACCAARQGRGQGAQGICWAPAGQRAGAHHAVPSYLVVSTSSCVLKPSWCPKPGRERRLILGRELFTILGLQGWSKGRAASEGHLGTDGALLALLSFWGA